MDIIKLIKEEFDKIQKEDMSLEEDYPTSFDMDHFKSLRSFNLRIQYCEKHLQRISSGSGRVVYKIDDEKVLKLAKNAKGVAQNEVEIQHSHYEYVFAEVFDSHDDAHWLEMELCKKLSVGRFQQLIGMKFSDFQDIIYFHSHKFKPKEYNKHSEPSIPSDEYWENEFISGILTYMGSYDIKFGDLTRISTYGENSQNEVVIIDYGLSTNVWNDHYDTSKKQMARYY